MGAGGNDEANPKAAKQNVGKAQQAAARKQTIAHMPKKTRSALGKQAAAVVQRKRTGAATPRLRQPRRTARATLRKLVKRSAPVGGPANGFANETTRGGGDPAQDQRQRASSCAGPRDAREPQGCLVR